MSILIEVNEFVKKYNINDINNKKLVDACLNREFPDFESDIIESTIEGNFLKVDIMPKEAFIENKKEVMLEEISRIKLIELFDEVSEMNKELVNDIIDKIGIPKDKFSELTAERFKVIFGNYYTALQKLHDENFLKYMVNCFKNI